MQQRGAVENMIIVSVILGSIAGAVAGVFSLIGTGSVLYSLFVYSGFGSATVLMLCSLHLLVGCARSKVSVTEVPIGLPRFD